MKRGLSYLPAQQVFPTIGLNVLEPSSQADPRTSPALNNFTIQKGLPQKRMGYYELGAAFHVLEFSGVVSGGTFTLTFDGHTTAAIDWDATNEEIATAITGTTFFTEDDFTISGGPIDVDNPVIIVWQNLPTKSINPAGLTGGGSATLTESGGLTGDVIGLHEFESLSGVKTLIAVTVSNIYKLDSGSEPYIWTDISGDMDWTGDEEDFVEVVEVTGKDSSGNYDKWMVITNGKSNDVPQYWNGDDEFADYEPDIPDFDTYRTMQMFFNLLVLANITTTGQNRQLIGWSERQELTKFLVADNGAGEIIVPGVDGQFLRALPLSDRLVLYSEESICMMAYVGGTAIFSVEKVTDETRLVSPRAIINLGPFHLFLSQENVFLFDGTRLLRTMGDRIYRQYRDELAVDRAYEAFAFHDSPRQQVHFVVPIGAADHAVYVLEYDLTDINSGKWTRYQYADRPTAMGSWSRVSSLTFDSYWATHTNADLATFPANQGQTKKGFPVRVIACGNRVFVADETVSNDDGTAIEATWETVDFVPGAGFPSEYARWLEIEIEARGTTMVVSTSVDGGRNFTVQETLTLNSNWETYHVMIDEMGPTLRVRMQNTELNGMISHRVVRVWLRPGGPTL